jgi:hypothetical protein
VNSAPTVNIWAIRSSSISGKTTSLICRTRDWIHVRHCFFAASYSPKRTTVYKSYRNGRRDQRKTMLSKIFGSSFLQFYISCFYLGTHAYLSSIFVVQNFQTLVTCLRYISCHNIIRPLQKPTKAFEFIFRSAQTFSRSKSSIVLLKTAEISFNIRSVHLRLKTCLSSTLTEQVQGHLSR